MIRLLKGAGLRKPSRAGITRFEGSLDELDGKVARPAGLLIAQYEGLALMWDLEPAGDVLALHLEMGDDVSDPVLRIPLTEDEAKGLHGLVEKGGWGFYDMKEDEDRAAVHVSFMNAGNEPDGFLWLLDGKRRKAIRKAMDRFVGAGDPIFGDGSRSRPRTEARRSRSETDEALALLDSLLELWGDGPDAPSSRERDHLLIFGEPERPYSLADELEAEFDDEHFLESLLEPPGPRGPEYQERLEAGRLSMKLWLDFKPPGREEAIQTLPYRDFRVAEALLEDSEQYVTKYPQPRYSRGTARLAEQIAQLLEAEHLAKAWAIQAHARCLQGNAERLLQNWAEAEEHFRCARSLLSGLVRSPVHAVYFHQLACLREDQGRLAEATALVREAEALFREWSHGRRVTDCLIQLGFLYLQQNDPGRALPVLVEAHDRVPSLFPYLVARLELGQAMCFAAAGLPDLARQVKAESLRQRKCIRKHEERFKVEWLECRISLHLGDLDEAIPRLEALRRRYLEHNDLSRICLCSLDLAYAYARAGRLAELPGLIDDISEKRGAGNWPLDALRRFGEEVLDEARDPAAAAREAATLLFLRGRTFPD